MGAPPAVLSALAARDRTGICSSPERLSAATGQQAEGFTADAEPSEAADVVRATRAALRRGYDPDLVRRDIQAASRPRSLSEPAPNRAPSETLTPRTARDRSGLTCQASG